MQLLNTPWLGPYIPQPLAFFASPLLTVAFNFFFPFRESALLFVSAAWRSLLSCSLGLAGNPVTSRMKRVVELCGTLHVRRRCGG